MKITILFEETNKYNAKYVDTLIPVADEGNLYPFITCISSSLSKHALIHGFASVDKTNATALFWDVLWEPNALVLPSVYLLIMLPFFTIQPPTC